MSYGGIIGQQPVLEANGIAYNNSQTSSIITGDNVQTAIDQLFTSVSNGKNKIASAITDKGISTSSNDSFDVMAGNIGKIVTSTIGVFYTKNKEIISGSETITIPKTKPDAKLLFIAWMVNREQFYGSYAITPISVESQKGDTFVPFSSLSEAMFSIGADYDSVTGYMENLFSDLKNYTDRYELTLNNNSSIYKAIFITI